MEHRLACIASSVEELKGRLQDYLHAPERADRLADFHLGEVKKNREALSGLDAHELTRSWLQKRDLGKLLTFWTRGLGFDWMILYGEHGLYGELAPQRVSLPVYPFARERHWIQPPLINSASCDGVSAAVSSKLLHPLLHSNTSSFNAQQFTSVFSGTEFFLSDHVVNGAKMLPGVCYLEMARAAIERSLDLKDSPEAAIEVRDLVWVKPLIVTGSQEVCIRLYSDESDEIDFEVCTVGETEESEVKHAQGRAVLAAATLPSQQCDVNALLARCSGSIDMEQCYGRFAAGGIVYGPAHRGLTSLQVGTDEQGERFVLAHVQLPACVSEGTQRYTLHPSVLDSALQATAGLSFIDTDSGTPGAGGPAVPFALQSLQVLDRTPATGWVVVHPSHAAHPGKKPGGSRVQKLDIDVCDESGRVCVRLQGLSARVLEAKRVQPPQEEQARTILLKGEWDEQTATRPPDGNSELVQAAQYGQHCVLLDGAYGKCLAQLEVQWPAVKWTLLEGSATTEESVAQRVCAAGERVFDLVQRILREKPHRPVLLQVVLATESDGPIVGAQELRAAAERSELAVAMSGLLKSARHENPHLIGQVVGLAGTANAQRIGAAVEESGRATGPDDMQIRYRGDRREVFSIRELEKKPESSAADGLSPWRDGDVYLLTGGAGGLGLLLVEEIARLTQGARIVLTGRSVLTSERAERIKELEKQGRGIQIEYRAMDVTDATAVRECVAQIVRQHGALHGIVHCAGVIEDNFIIRKSVEEFRRVLAPKVQGTLNLDAATQGLELRWLLLFGSMSGAYGNVGQSDYAYANAFMDGFARCRAERVARGECHGRTVSIDWPLWAQSGMKVDESTHANHRLHGLAMLQTAAGMQALDQAWQSGMSQVVVVAQSGGKPTRPKAAGAARNLQHESEERSQASGGMQESAAGLRDNTIQYLKKLLSQSMGLSVDQIDADTPLEELGFDSILAMSVANELEGVLGALPKTLMFDYQTIDELAEYFLDSHREALLSLLIRPEGPGASTQDAESAAVAAAPPERVSTALEQGRRKLRRSRQARTDEVMETIEARPGFDVAIIGLGGRYPQAGNVREFWDNLKAGRDCLTEIARKRWDRGMRSEEYGNTPGNTGGKWGGFIDGVDEFDAQFFNIPPIDAKFIDPQERLFLQCVHQTLEDAGYAPDGLCRHGTHRLSGNVGVFVGVMYEEYQLYGAQVQSSGRGHAVGGSPSSIAERVSYFCNFHGPSLAVDTMCSSSLTAIHLACQSLKAGGCEVAVAGGVNVSVQPNLALARGHVVCGGGKGASGYVPGEGVGAVLLKPLARAIADGDFIYGVIKGAAISHGGRTDVYGIPNPQAQAEVIARALHESGVDARAISYLEEHGAGTALEDPSEVAAVSQAFAAYSDRRQSCAIGSMKFNIGHLESAAGIAALTKVLLQMQHRTLVPGCHSGEPTARADFANTPFKIQRTLEEWRRPVLRIDGVEREYPRIAGICAFGAGGANAHLIVQEYCEQRAEQADVAEPTARPPALIVLSAKSAEQLQEQARQLLEHLDRLQGMGLLNDESSYGVLIDVAYTLQVGREAMEHRLACAADSIKDLKGKLARYVQGRADRGRPEDLRVGEVKQHRDALAEFNADEETAQLIQRWLHKGKVSKLLDVWVKGLAFDWTTLYGEAGIYGRVKPRRMPLPGYPFAREKYWVDGNLGATAPDGNVATKEMRALREQLAQGLAGSQLLHSQAADEDTHSGESGVDAFAGPTCDHTEPVEILNWLLPESADTGSLADVYAGGERVLAASEAQSSGA